MPSDPHEGLDGAGSVEAVGASFYLSLGRGQLCYWRMGGREACLGVHPGEQGSHVRGLVVALPVSSLSAREKPEC